MGTPIDLRRITALQNAMGVDVEELVREVLANMNSAIGELESALERADLDAAAQAAHACRNDAALVQAQRLLVALEGIESAARAGELEPVRAALPELRYAWPMTRAQLERLLAAR